MLTYANGKYIDAEGNIIEKNKIDYPYNYSTNTIWINRDIKINKKIY